MTVFLSLLTLSGVKASGYTALLTLCWAVINEQQEHEQRIWSVKAALVGRLALLTAANTTVGLVIYIGWPNLCFVQTPFGCTS